MGLGTWIMMGVPPFEAKLYILIQNRTYSQGLTIPYPWTDLILKIKTVHVYDKQTWPKAKLGKTFCAAGVDVRLG